MDYQSDNELYPSGMIIADNYEIVKHLASGGMAHVYIALQNKLGRRVALKVLNSTCCANHSVVTRFVNEARIVAQLHHPHIVEVYDVGETEDHRSFMAMELLEGRSLGDRIKEGAMSPQESYPIVRQVAESLAEAHAKGVIHRDLKPDNIFLTLKSGVKTLDFGIAKVLHSDSMDKAEEKLTRAGTAPGTPEYMSPEQARGQDLDARSDLYSLGIVFYEMLSGHPPFEEPTFLATILKQVQSPPPPLPANVPVPLANYIINRLLAKDANCRPENANALIAELDELAIKLNIKADEAAQGQSLIIALSEIEQLKLQLAATQQELQRSRDMACLEIEDLNKANESSLRPPADAVQGLSIAAPGASNSGSPSLSVNMAGLANLQPSSSNKQSFIEPRNMGEGSMSMNMNQLSAGNLGMNANTAVPPARNGAIPQPMRRPAQPMQPGAGHAVQPGTCAPPPVPSAYHSGVAGVSANESVPPARNTVMPSNPAYSRATVPPRGVVAPNGVPANGVPMSNRVGVAPNVMPTNAAAMSGRGVPVSPNVGMQNATGMMQQAPTTPAHGANMASNGVSQAGPVANSMMANAPAMSAPVGASGRGMRPGYDDSNSNRPMPQPPASPMASRNRPMPVTPGRRPNPNVSSEISSQNPRIERGQEVERQNRAASQSGMRQAPQSRQMQENSMSFGASDMVMSAHSYEVMRSLEMSNQEAGRTAAVDSYPGSGRNHADAEDVWQPSSDEFYGSGVLRDDSAYSESHSSGCQESPPSRRQPNRPAEESFYDNDDEEDIVVPQPRFASQQNLSPVHETSSYGRRKSTPNEAGRNGAGRNVSVSAEAVSETSFRSKPQDVLTGRVSSKSGRSRIDGAAQEKFMQFSQPLLKIFGPSRIEAMLHFSQGIWNAAIMGTSAICELKESLRDNAAMLKLVDGMIGRKLKMFDSDRWIIDELSVTVDASGRMSMDFVQIKSE